MSHKSLRKSLAFILTLSLLLSNLTPALAATSQGQPPTTSSLSIEAFGDFGAVGDQNFVSGMAQNTSGDALYVVGSANSKMGTTDPDDATERVFLSKFSTTDLRKPAATTVLMSKNDEPITHNGEASGYPFGIDNTLYMAGDSLGNSGIAVAQDGSVYIAVIERPDKQLYSITDICSSYSPDLAVEGCTCQDVYQFCDEDTQYSACPVCSVYKAFADSFQPTPDTVSVELYKYDSNLNLVGQKTIGSYKPRYGGTLGYPTVRTIAIDNSGNIYVGGGAFDDMGFVNPTYGFHAFDDNTGGQDGHQRGYIAKVSPDLTQVTASTYFGGPCTSSNTSGQEIEVTGLAVDGNSLYVTGGDSGGKIPTQTSSAFPNKVKPEDNARDSYIAKLDTNDLKSTAATYFGGDGHDDATSIQITADGVYIAGSTPSANLPVSGNAYQSTKNSNSNEFYTDCFIARFPKDLSNTGFAATYLGGSSSESLFGLDVDSTGNIYITGGMQSRTDSLSQMAAPRAISS